MLKKSCTILQKYRNTGFKRAILSASELTEELDIESLFRFTAIIGCVKRQAGKSIREEFLQRPRIVIEFFNCLSISVNENFEQEYFCTIYYIFHKEPTLLNSLVTCN